MVADDNSKNLRSVILGKNKSGRVWKKTQSTRASSQSRTGVLSHLCKTYEERKYLKEGLERVKSIEKQMKDEKIARSEEEKRKRLEKEQRRLANEQKSSSFQQINPEKLKSMSKKQLRMIRKTSINKTGQMEYVGLYNTKTSKR